MRIDAWSMTHTGLVRPSNQDSVGCFPELGLFVVADGMGGHAHGEVASSMAVAAVHEFVARHQGGRGRSSPVTGGEQMAARLSGVPNDHVGPAELEAAVVFANQ